jgi:hypothetical protein
MTTSDESQSSNEIALWVTQGGNPDELARWDHAAQAYVWHQLPDDSKFKLGAKVHEEWGVLPANEAAQREMLDADDDPLDNIEYDLGKILGFYNQ